MDKLPDDITKTSVRLLIREPFYGHLCAMILRVVTDQEGRVALGWTDDWALQLRVHRAYWNSLRTEDQKLGVIKHQLLHLVFKHPFRRHAFGNKTNFDIAADLVVNQYLSASQLTADAITIAQYGFPVNLPLEAYYRLLQEHVGWLSTGAEHGPLQQQNGTMAPGGGHGTSQDAENAAATNDRGKNGPLSEHALWDIDAASGSSIRELTSQQVDELITASCKRLGAPDMGKLPAHVRDHLQQILERFKPIVSWKRVLKLFAASARKTYLEGTVKRASKRFGTVPGIRIRCKQRILVAIDTSGSINLEDLESFFGEVYHIWKQGAEVMVIECDAAIQATWVYKGKSPTAVTGGGGTDLTPPIVFANGKYRPDALIYFTDGRAQAPAVKSRAPVLWLVSSGGISEKDWHFLPGRKVKMR